MISFDSKIQNYILDILGHEIKMREVIIDNVR